MLIAYAAAKRGPPVGRIRTAAILRRRSPRRSTALRRETPCLCLARRSAHRPLPRRRGLSRYSFGLRQTRRLSPRGRQTPFARDRKACPPRGVAGLHPVVVGHPARFVSCSRPPRAAPCGPPPSRCAIHSPLRSPRRSYRHLHQTGPYPQQNRPCLHENNVRRMMCPTLVLKYLATLHPEEGPATAHGRRRKPESGVYDPPSLGRDISSWLPTVNGRLRPNQGISGRPGESPDATR